MKQLVVLLMIVALIGCRDHDSVGNCNVAEPIEDLPWLKAKVNELKTSSLADYAYVSQGLYLGETVFTVDYCCPTCLYVRPVYKCNGTEIEGPDYKLVVSSKIIWKSDNFQCQLM